MWADALTKEMVMHKDMKELLTEGNFELQDEGINKVQCVLNGEIRMTNIKNRDKNSVENSMDEMFASHNLFNTDVRM